MSLNPHRLWLSLVLVVSATFVGAVAGAFTGGHLWPSPGGGLEAVANALGGAVLGGGLSLMISIVVSFRLRTERLHQAAVWALGTAVVALAILLVRARLEKTVGSQSNLPAPVPVNISRE